MNTRQIRQSTSTATDPQRPFESSHSVSFSVTGAITHSDQIRAALMESRALDAGGACLNYLWLSPRRSRSQRFRLQSSGLPLAFHSASDKIAGALPIMAWKTKHLKVHHLVGASSGERNLVI